MASFASRRGRSAQLLHALLTGIIRYSLEAGLPENAQFFGERMVAHFPADEEALFLLASSHFRRGRHATVLALLRSTSYPQSKYLLAQSCRAVGRLQEAEIHIQDLVNDTEGAGALAKVETSFRVELEMSAILCQQGFICKDANRTDQARDYFSTSLETNPFLWSSLHALCQMGTDVDVDSILDTAKAIQFLRSIPGLIPPELFHNSAHADAPSALSSRSSSSVQHFHPEADRPGSAAAAAAAAGRENKLADIGRADSQNLFQQPRSRTAFTYGLRPYNGQDVTARGALAVPALASSRSASARTPSVQPVEASIPPPAPVLEPPQPIKSSQTTKTKSAVEIKPTVQTRKTKVATDAASNSSASSSVQTRRSTRAVGTSKAETGTSNALRDRKKTTKAAAPAEAPKAARDADMDIKMEDAVSTMSSPLNPMDAIDWLEVEPVVEALFGILRVLGSGFNHLCQYRCKEAFDTFALVSPEHYNTGWVLCQVARAQFEMAEYRRSEQLFLQARELEPYRVDDMEVFSVALWHLHKEVELSYLAHDLVELDKKRPQAWCAVGNSFSLKQEHDLALKCFQRAIQLDPQFAYAYTLAGHEYIANEDLDKAQGSFRNALRVDERHYNAWYGLGYLFYRQEKLQMAKFHFESALMINKDSPILTYYIGMVLQNTDRKEEALLKYEEALQMAPKNPLFRFAKAEVLFALQQFPEALTELQNLAGYTQEPNVYFLMGKVYKALGDNRNALLAFTKSDSRSNKSSVTIKDQIERLQEDVEGMSP